MSLVQSKPSGMGLASSGGDPPKKPTGNPRLPLPVDRPNIKLHRKKKAQAPQVINTYADLPDKSGCYELAVFSKAPPPHLSEGDKNKYGRQHNLLSGAAARVAAGSIKPVAGRDIGSRARQVMWRLWFAALEEARRLGEARGEDSSDDAEGETDLDADAEGETDEDTMDETEDEAEVDSDPEIKEEEEE